MIFKLQHISPVELIYTADPSKCFHWYHSGCRPSRYQQIPIKVAHLI